MLDGDDFSGSMIESVVDLLGSHDDLRLEDLQRDWIGFGTGLVREWLGLVSQKRR